MFWFKFKEEEIDFFEQEAIDPCFAMEEAFVEFSAKSSVNFDEKASRNLFVKMLNRKLRDVSGKSGTDKAAKDSYKTLVTMFKKSPP